ncbi:MAG: transglutaminase domain-containing protein, partial [Erysipelotrichaceae bacterium]|nr:transglutaminase domain-containing protein [Erysipelotrichaceae bacterium]
PVSFDKDKAVANDEVVFDLSHTAEGYFSISVVSNKKLKMRVIKNDSEEYYDYDLNNDGTVCYYPLQMGNGSYMLVVYKNIEDTKYAALDYVNTDVVLADEFQPYIRPTYFIFYTKDSDCVKKAYELTRTASTVNQYIKNVYDFVCKNIKYDKKKAENLPKIYAPDPDETMNTGKGICFDYAALAAAMLRSQGVPCKLIMGNVSPNDLYHAWNMFYTEETGWITVKFEVNANDWTRLDLTFSANGEDADFIGNGENYTDMKEY